MPRAAVLLTLALAAWPPLSVADRVVIPEGALLMGSDAGLPSESPIHEVVLSAFLLDRWEVTNAEFEAFVVTSDHLTDPERSGHGWHWDGRWHIVSGADWRRPRGPGSGIEDLRDHPVVQVSWRDARAFCAWQGARLPTEAEWERAARGAGSRAYAWGDQPPRDGDRIRASSGAERCCRADDGDGYLYTAPVGRFGLGRSPFGAEDMTGNVWEWVEDGFDAGFYGRSPGSNPVNRRPGSGKVIRGGGWGNDAWGLRATLRHTNPPDIGLSMVGFRCAASMP